MKHYRSACKEPGCTNIGNMRSGFCQKHHTRKLVDGSIERKWTRGRRCKVEGCNRKHDSHGYCNIHAIRYRRFGDPLRANVQTDFGSHRKFLSELLSREDFGEECIRWPFAINPTGINVHGIGKVCRYICKQVHGEPPKDGVYHAAHSCGKGHEGCINPDHLYWATPEQNAWDKLKHGTLLQGEKCPWSKLTKEQVLLIREASSDKASKQKLSSLYGVSIGSIEDIQHRRTWRWLA